MAYAELEPFGQQALAWQIAVVAATVANVNRGNRTKAFQPQDFMPEEPLLPEERAARLRQKFDAAMMGLGGRARRPGDPPRGQRRTPSTVREVPPRRGGRRIAEARRRGT